VRHLVATLALAPASPTVHRRSTRVFLGPLVVCFALLAACSNEESYTPQPLEPYWPTDGWRTADARDVDLDLETLESMVAHIEGSDADVDSVSVVRHGYLVLDRYFPPFAVGQTHNVYSCTKSVVSTLIGIALDEGLLTSLDQRLLGILGDRTVQNSSASKEAITLAHLLTMSAGLDARDSYLYEWEGLVRMRESPDAVQYVLDLPMASEPGARFEYTNGVSHLLSAIVTETTGQSALAYAREKLFGPLGISSTTWDADSQGRNWGYAQLHLTPHDMAKIGLLFLNRGRWDASQIVSESWVDVATTRHLAATLVDGYGYQWWVDASGYYLALGYRGQFIFVVPGLDLVAVFTGASPETFDFTLPLIETYIIPAASR